MNKNKCGQDRISSKDGSRYNVQERSLPELPERVKSPKILEDIKNNNKCVVMSSKDRESPRTVAVATKPTPPVSMVTRSRITNPNRPVMIRSRAIEESDEFQNVMVSTEYLYFSVQGTKYLYRVQNICIEKSIFLVCSSVCLGPELICCVAVVFCYICLCACVFLLCSVLFYLLFWIVPGNLLHLRIVHFVFTSKLVDLRLVKLALNFVLRKLNSLLLTM